jgi:predicted alpha/beta superfamily hydrolase
MKKEFLICVQFFLVLVLAAQQTIRINIEKLPQSSTQYDLFVAGSFNGWNPGNSQYKFQKDEKGKYYIDLKLAAGNYEYKITRGSWKEVECGANGVDKGNRVLKISKDEIFNISIEGWKDNFQSQAIKHTVSSHVKIIDTAFLIPQLNRTRRVWIYLPEGYDNSKKNIRFPVLYFHDGQNVFDDATSFAGEWGVDEFLDTTKARTSIVVAIDNGGSKRLNEYCPYDFSLKSLGRSSADSLNKGEGKMYVDFLVKTLKPFIDKNYRTLKDKANTFVAGSSMGGLISMYAVLKYPKVFGGAGVFSPAFWVGPKIFDEIKSMGKKVRSKIYFYAGKLEGDKMVPDMLKAFQDMKKVSRSKMTTVVREDGKHNEPTWRKEFPLFYEWLLAN